MSGPELRHAAVVGIFYAIHLTVGEKSLLKD